MISENVYSNNYRLEAKQMAEDGYQATKTGLVLAMDRNFEQIIQDKCKVDTPVKGVEEVAPTLTVNNKRASMSYKGSTHSLGSSKLTSPKITYPKYSDRKKDKNKEFNTIMLSKLSGTHNNL